MLCLFTIIRTYNYLITAENIPTKLNDCPIISNQSECVISMRWFLNKNVTELDMIPETRHTRSKSSEHTVTVDAILGNNGSSQELQHSLYYFCSTDKCNSPVMLKRLLQSLTLTDQFMELKDLLKPSAQFDGHWCLLLSNQTTEACKVPVIVDRNDCKQCSTTFTTESKKDGTICAGCYTDSIHQEFLGREILFNLTDQTQTEIEMITCRSQNCNAVRTIDLIREKSRMNFDFVKFLNGGSRMNALTSFSGTIMMLMLFFVKEIF
ncbi:hypothetical protein I4U23_022955 [Adineta vaga]|nr:hypothetical protein I4U23_022955 [Adineta vaga]